MRQNTILIVANYQGFTTSINSVLEGKPTAAGVIYYITSSKTGPNNRNGYYFLFFLDLTLELQDHVCVFGFRIVLE